LAGDFNAAPDSASVRFWQGLQSLGDTSVCYRDAWKSTHPEDPGHTFTPRNPLVAGGDNWQAGAGPQDRLHHGALRPPRTYT